MHKHDWLKLGITALCQVTLVGFLVECRLAGLAHNQAICRLSSSSWQQRLCRGAGDAADHADDSASPSAATAHPAHSL